MTSFARVSDADVSATSAPTLCRNYETHDICNWALDPGDTNPLCRSCRLTSIIPDLSTPAGLSAWHRLEVAKRRLLVTLLTLNLPVADRQEEPARGLGFEFKGDPGDPGAPRVMTGHADGVITVNIAEADDAERERRRHDLREPYRTLLGHFRHESGHYYWDRLVRDTPSLDAFRAVFGDERRDYAGALAAYYQSGPPEHWQAQFVSAYASAHPWEDWAETWAHYLHIVDTVETAAGSGLQLRPRRSDDPVLPRLPEAIVGTMPFEVLIDSWFPLTYILNNLNRGMGLPDAYPFALSGAAIEKLRCVDQIVAAAGRPTA